MADELAGSSQPLVQAEKETEPVVGALFLCCHCPVGPSGWPQSPKGCCTCTGSCPVLTNAATWLRVAQPEPLSFNPPAKDNKDTNMVQWYFQGATKPCFLYFFKVSKESHYSQIQSYGQQQTLYKEVRDKNCCLIE